MQGLLGRLPFAPLGPQAVRQLAEQKAQQYMPQGGGRIIPASGGVIKQPSMAAEIGAGLSGLGEALGAFGNMRKEKALLKKKEADRVGKIGAVRNALFPDQNKVMAAQGGPTNAAAAEMRQSDPLGLTPDMAQAIMSMTEADPDKGFALVSSIMQSKMKPKKREIVKGPDGIPYYADTTEPVLPGVKGEPGSVFGKSTQGLAMDAWMRFGSIPDSQLTQEQIRQKEMARWALQNPKTQIMPDGSVIQSRPSPLPGTAPVTPVTVSQSDQPPAAKTEQIAPNVTKTTTTRNLSPSDAKRVDEWRASIRSSDAAVNTLVKALSLNEKAYSGRTAKLVQEGSRFLGINDERVTATTEFENLVLRQALPAIKQLFGAAPSERESKMAVELEAAIHMSPSERKVLLENAIDMARSRGAAAREDFEAFKGNSMLEMPTSKPEVTGNFSDMSPDELLGVDINGLTPDEVRAWMDELDRRRL